MHKINHHSICCEKSNILYFVISSTLSLSLKISDCSPFLYVIVVHWDYCRKIFRSYGTFICVLAQHFFYIQIFPLLMILIMVQLHLVQVISHANFQGRYICNKYTQRLQNSYEQFYFALIHWQLFGCAQKSRFLVQNVFSSKFYVTTSTALKCTLFQMISWISIIVDNL